MKQTNQLLWLGLSFNVLMCLMYFLASIHSGASLFFSQAIHYSGDIILDGFMVWVARHIRQQPTQTFPYGFLRLETMCVLVVSIIFLHMGASIVFHGTEPVTADFPKGWSILPVIGLLGELFIIILWRHWSQKYDSILLRTAAKHLLMDALFSALSLAVCIAHWLSPTFAHHLFFGMGLYLCYQGGYLAWPALMEIMDKGIQASGVQQIEHIALEIPGVVSVHQIRTRSISEMVMIELHIECHSRITISEGHYIAESVIIAIKKHLANVLDVSIHVDPEANHEVDLLPNLMPNRPEVIAFIKKQFHISAESVVLHYLTGGLEVIVHNPSRYPKKQEIDAVVRQTSFLQSIVFEKHQSSS
ncbi:MAG: cation diffusion facilitator family transporter [Candidatus Comchoanobacterales bacterium]